LNHAAAPRPTGSVGGETGDAVEDRYAPTNCRSSTVVPGRVYFYLTPKGGLAYHDGPYYSSSRPV